MNREIVNPGQDFSWRERMRLRNMRPTRSQSVSSLAFASVEISPTRSANSRWVSSSFCDFSLRRTPPWKTAPGRTPVHSACAPPVIPRTLGAKDIATFQTSRSLCDLGASLPATLRPASFTVHGSRFHVFFQSPGLRRNHRPNSIGPRCTARNSSDTVVSISVGVSVCSGPSCTMAGGERPSPSALA